MQGETSLLDDAPELRAYHDEIFDEAEKNGTDIYGSPSDWSKVKASGHYRRIKVLDSMILTDLSEKVVVDFGTGPWGFACVFPRLREAKQCIGFDVSKKALDIASKQDGDLGKKVSYYVSEGDTIALDDNSIDIFWGGEVIEHVRNPLLFLQEVARICKDGAKVILSTPNRDAIYYSLRGEDYAIGAEHIALMNFDELKSNVSKFFTDIRIIGYETSLSSELDNAPFTERMLDIIQDRAARSPESASGLIVEAVTDKSLFRQNSQRQELDEFIWSHPRVKGNKSAIPMMLFSHITGGSILLDVPLEFEVFGETLILLFWAHSWSGNVEVHTEDKTHKLSLYSPHGGFRRVEIALSQPGAKNVIIRRIGSKSELSQDDQVIFYKGMCYRALKP